MTGDQRDAEIMLLLARLRPVLNARGRRIMYALLGFM